MRTKTLLLSALLGALGGVSVHAQNVYSLNAVGYINETIYPGFNLISCPLLTSPDQTLNSILPNTPASGQQFNGDTLYFFDATTGSYSSVQGRQAGTSGTGWVGLGTNIINPGTGFWLLSSATSNTTVTLVGTVPSGPITNTLTAGFNLVSSVVPMSGDLYSNSLAGTSGTLGFTNVNAGDTLYVFDPTQQKYAFAYKAVNPAIAGNGGSPWKLTAGGDPILPNVGEAFFYLNTGATIGWVEDYSVSQ
jgi:hypothetical protein